MSSLQQNSLGQLKAKAQLLKPSIHLGKAGPTPEFYAALEEVLSKSQLVKIRFDSFKDERKSLSIELANKTGSRLVQQVGHTAVLFRENAGVANPTGD